MKQVKRYHLKDNVKIALLVIVGLAVCIPTLMNMGVEDEKAMQHCMQKNNNYNYCINGLRG